MGRWHLLALALAVATLLLLHTTAASPLKSRPRQDGAGGGAAPGSLSPPVNPNGGGQITPPPPAESDDDGDPAVAQLADEDSTGTGDSGTMTVPRQPETDLINMQRLPVGQVPDGGVEAAQLAEAAENSEPSEGDTGMTLPNLLENIKNAVFPVPQNPDEVYPDEQTISLTVPPAVEEETITLRAPVDPVEQAELVEQAQKAQQQKLDDDATFRRTRPAMRRKNNKNKNKSKLRTNKNKGKPKRGDDAFAPYSGDEEEGEDGGEGDADAGEEDTMEDAETGGDDSMEEDMEGDDGGEDSEGAQDKTETEDSRPQLFVPLPNNPLATWLQENSADVDDSKAGTLSVPFAPVIAPALHTPISPEDHQLAAETGDTIVDVQAAQAQALQEQEAQEAEDLTRAPPTLPESIAEHLAGRLPGQQLATFIQPEVEEEPESGAGTQHVPVEPETPLINQDRLPVGLGVPQSGVEAAQLSEAAENPENQGGMPIPDLTKTFVNLIEQGGLIPVRRPAETVSEEEAMNQEGSLAPFRQPNEPTITLRPPEGIDPVEQAAIIEQAQQQQQQTLDDATQEEDYDSGAGREAVVPAGEEGEGGAGLAAETRSALNGPRVQFALPVNPRKHLAAIAAHNQRVQDQRNNDDDEYEYEYEYEEEVEESDGDESADDTGESSDDSGDEEENGETSEQEEAATANLGDEDASEDNSKFSMYDEDEDGMWDEDELIEYICSQPDGCDELDEGDVEAYMEHLDLDKSGTISMNEFDSSGVTSTGGGEDDGGAQVSNLQEETGDEDDQDEEQGSDNGGSEDHSEFSKYDTDNDNVITKAELSTYLTSVKEDATEGELEDYWTIMDADGNGSIDSEEFAAAFDGSGGSDEPQVSNLQGEDSGDDQAENEYEDDSEEDEDESDDDDEPEQQTSLRDRFPDEVAQFDKFDDNNDGKITGGELSSYFSDLGEAQAPEEIDTIFATLDNDKDEYINLIEYLTDGEASSLEDIGDVNGDGDEYEDSGEYEYGEEGEEAEEAEDDRPSFSLSVFRPPSLGSLGSPGNFQNFLQGLFQGGGLQAAALGDEEDPAWAQNINLAEIAKEQEEHDNWVDALNENPSNPDIERPYPLLQPMQQFEVDTGEEKPQQLSVLRPVNQQTIPVMPLSAGQLATADPDNRPPTPGISRPNGALSANIDPDKLQAELDNTPTAQFSVPINPEELYPTPPQLFVHQLTDAEVGQLDDNEPTGAGVPPVINTLPFFAVPSVPEEDDEDADEEEDGTGTRHSFRSPGAKNKNKNKNKRKKFPGIRPTHSNLRGSMPIRHGGWHQNVDAAYFSESRKSPELFAETRQSTTNKRIRLSVPVAPEEHEALIAAALINEDAVEDRPNLGQYLNEDGQQEKADYAAAHPFEAGSLFVPVPQDQLVAHLTAGDPAATERPVVFQAPMTVDQQEEEIALLVQEHVDNPETVVTQLNTFLTPLQHEELKLTGGLPQQQLHVPQSPEEQALAVALLQDASETSTTRPMLTVPAGAASPKPNLPRLNVGVDIIQHLGEIEAGKLDQVQVPADLAGREAEADPASGREAEANAGVIVINDKVAWTDGIGEDGSPNILGSDGPGFINQQVGSQIGQFIENAISDAVNVLGHLTGQLDAAVSEVFRPTVTVEVTATYTTRTVTEHNSCYSAAVSMNDCALSRRISRKFGLIEERPILDVGGYRVPLVLRPSKASQFNNRQGREDGDVVLENDEIAATSETEEPVEQQSEAVEEDSEAVEQSEVVEQSEAAEQSEAVEPAEPVEPSDEEEVVVESSSSTATVTVTATQTITSTGPVQTLRFTSDAEAPGCMPVSLMAAQSIGQC